MWTTDRTLYCTKALFRNSFLVVGQPSKSSSESNLLIWFIFTIYALSTFFIFGDIKWCGGLQIHRTVNDFLKLFYLVKAGICCLVFLVIDIKYFSGRSDNTVEKEAVPRKMNIFIYLKWLYSFTFVFITSIDWWMRFLSISSSVFWPQSLWLTVFLVFLLKWLKYASHLMDCNLQLWFQAGVGGLCCTFPHSPDISSVQILLSFLHLLPFFFFPEENSMCQWIVHTDFTFTVLAGVCARSGLWGPFSSTPEPQCHYQRHLFWFP